MTLLTVLLIGLGLTSWLGWHLHNRTIRHQLPHSVDWVDGFSPDKYKPLENLLSERDYVFLASQPGYHPSMARRLRKQRRRICRAYLRNLATDFDRLYAVAMQSAALDSEGGQEIVAALTHEKILFTRTLLTIRLRLALSSIGIRSANPTPILNAVRVVTALAQNS